MEPQRKVGTIKHTNTFTDGSYSRLRREKENILGNND